MQNMQKFASALFHWSCSVGRNTDLNMQNMQKPTYSHTAMPMRHSVWPVRGC